MSTMKELFLTLGIEMISFFAAYLAVMICDNIKAFLVAYSDVGLICVFSKSEHFGTIRKSDKLSTCNFSLICLTLGPTKYHIGCRIDKKVKLFYREKFEDVQPMNKTNINEVCEKFALHLKNQSNAQIQIEKEMLCYQIEKVKDRINTANNKANAYLTIFLVLLPFIFNFLKEGIIDNGSELETIQMIVLLYIVYLALNITLWLFNIYKVRSQYTSTFSSIKNDATLRNLVLQYYYDYQQMQVNANCMVGYIKNIEIWLKLFIIVFILYFVLSFVVL